MGGFEFDESYRSSKMFTFSVLKKTDFDSRK